jgi:hypothetical protein
MGIMRGGKLLLTLGSGLQLMRVELQATGATLHTVCVTNGPLRTYKLFARTYGGKGDEDINRHHKHTVT